VLAALAVRPVPVVAVPDSPVPAQGAHPAEASARVAHPVEAAVVVVVVVVVDSLAAVGVLRLGPEALQVVAVARRLAAPAAARVSAAEAGVAATSRSSRHRS
jgi:hypothetical protein